MTGYGSALLLDLENVLHVGDSDNPECEPSWACDQRADQIVAWMIEQASTRGQKLSFSLATCSDGFLSRYLGKADFPHWINLRLVEFGVKDAAEQFLLTEAEHLLARGYRDFFIGSGDGAFCELSTVPGVQTTVLVQHLRSLSRRLELSSTYLSVAPTLTLTETAA